MIDLPAGRPHARAVRPRVSFVVAWQGSPTELLRRLQIWDRWVDDGVDVVVVCSCPPGDRHHIERSHPDVRVVNARADEELSTLRQLGVSAAQGDIVVIIDDTVAWTASWRDHLPVAIGGDVLARQDAPWLGLERATRAVQDATVR